MKYFQLQCIKNFRKRHKLLGIDYPSLDGRGPAEYISWSNFHALSQITASNKKYTPSNADY